MSRTGIEIDLPEGWDGRIYRRDAGEAVTRRAMHAANFALPTNLGDYAAGAVEGMRSDDVLVVLIEFDPSSAGSALFRSQGMPTSFAADAFSPNAMPHAIPGRTATQHFFSLAGRAFCLYVVLGSHNNRAEMLPMVNAVVRTIRIED